MPHTFLRAAGLSGALVAFISGTAQSEQFRAEINLFKRIVSVLVPGIIKRRLAMKKSLLVCAALAIATMTAQAGDAPQFMKRTYPDHALQGAWSDWQAVFGKDGAVPQKYKELIALGVAAQVPCQYCVYAHTLLAKKHGATDAEIKEAIAAAALVRQWSTVLNGSAYNMKEFKAEMGPANDQVSE